MISFPPFPAVDLQIKVKLSNKAITRVSSYYQAIIALSQKLVGQ